MDYIQVEIAGLNTSPSTGNAYALILSEVDGTRRLPIIIGAFEAQAIALELEKIQPPRPMTHDLLRDAFDALGAEVTEVVIDELRDGTFFAKIRFTAHGEEGQLDARPSDAIALAVRCDASIFVSHSVMDEAGVFTEEPEAQAPARAERPVRPERPEPAATTAPRSRAEVIEAQLEEAIREENYERAAQLRDELRRLRGEEN